MPRYSRMTFATLCALGLLSATGAVGRAQPAPSPPQAADPSDTASDEHDSFPIFAVTGVEFLRTQQKPEVDVIVARGVTSTGGWTGGELIPLTKGSPSDNILDLVFVAQAPAETGAPLGYAPIYAVLPISPEHPFKAIRVRGAINSVVLKEIPGSVEAPVPPDPSKNSIGKYFVDKGQAAPTAVPAGELLRREDLPPNTRVIRPSDGIADVQRDPDRLTIVVGESGRVVDAVWE